MIDLSNRCQVVLIFAGQGHVSGWLLSRFCKSKRNDWHGIGSRAVARWWFASCGANFQSEAFREWAAPQKLIPAPIISCILCPIRARHAVPTQGRAGRPWDGGACPVGWKLGMRICNNGAYEPEPAQKRIVTGGLWATLVISLGPMAARHSCIRDASGPGGVFCCPVFA